MKKLFLFLITLIVVSSNSFSENLSKKATSRNSSFSIPSGFGIKNLNGLGNSGLINSTSNLGFMNPASIVNLPNYSIGLTYQVNTPVYFPKPNDDVSLSRVYNFIPQSFGAVCHFDDFSFGLSFGQEFNSSTDFGEFVNSIVTNEGIIEYKFHPIIESRIENYSFSLAYNIGNTIFQEAEVSIGLRYTLNRLHAYEKIDKAEANVSNYASSIDAGITLKYDKMQFGISFNSGKSFTYTQQDILINTLGVPGNTYIIDTYEVTDQIPSEASIDALFKIEEDLKLTASVNNIFWSSNYSPFTNQFDISSNLIYDPLNKLSGSLGLLLSSCFLEENYDNEYNALFIMMGLKLNYDNFNIDFALADSHLISGELRKQLIAKVGVGVIL